MKKIKKLEEEEHLNNLEIFIDCLKDITEEFKSKQDPTFNIREEVYYC